MTELLYEKGIEEEQSKIIILDIEGYKRFNFYFFSMWTLFFTYIFYMFLILVFIKNLEMFDLNAIFAYIIVILTVFFMYKSWDTSSYKVKTIPEKRYIDLIDTKTTKIKRVYLK